jgi:hypothetical protein
MIEQKKITKTPREHFKRAAEDEFARFVSREIAFQQADRSERAAELRLPISTRRRHSRSGFPFDHRDD